MSQPPPDVTAVMRELVSVLETIGKVHAQEHGEVPCPRCGGTLFWSTTFRAITVECKTTRECVRFRARGKFTLRRAIPVYRQEKLL